MPKTPAITAKFIRAALRRYFGQPEWAIMFEVSEGTGVHGGRRRADAIIMNMWPSRGLEVMGVEIKVSKSPSEKFMSYPSALA